MIKQSKARTKVNLFGSKVSETLRLFAASKMKIVQTARFFFFSILARVNKFLRWSALVFLLTMCWQCAKKICLFSFEETPFDTRWKTTSWWTLSDRDACKYDQLKFFKLFRAKFLFTQFSRRREKKSFANSKRGEINYLTQFHWLQSRHKNLWLQWSDTNIQVCEVLTHFITQMCAQLKISSLKCGGKIKKPREVGSESWDTTS